MTSTDALILRPNTTEIMNRVFDYYGLVLRLNSGERFRFVERAVIKIKDMEIIELENDMELLKNSINEVYRLLISA